MNSIRNMKQIRVQELGFKSSFQNEWYYESKMGKK
jgi:hypothetical protein